MMDEKRRTGAINDILGPDPRVKEKEPSEKGALHHCVEELIHAIHSKDIEGAAEALKTCFLELESESPEEDEHY